MNKYNWCKFFSKILLMWAKIFFVPIRFYFESAYQEQRYVIDFIYYVYKMKVRDLLFVTQYTSIKFSIAPLDLVNLPLGIRKRLSEALISFWIFAPSTVFILIHSPSCIVLSTRKLLYPRRLPRSRSYTYFWGLCRPNSWSSPSLLKCLPILD